MLPCGAGKTVVGIAAMQLLQTNTLVLTTNTVAVRQWVREILDKTTLTTDQVGEYTGEQAGDNAHQVAQKWREQNPDLLENYTIWADDLDL